MKRRFFNRKRKHTQYIQIDTKKCKGCWKCLEECPNGVIGKIDLPWHRHTIIIEPDACNGCLNCISICQNESFSPINGS